MWYQNLYILALNAAEGSDSAPGLYGSFVTADQMLWAGDLTLNYNAGAQANRMPLVALYCSFLQKQRTNIFPLALCVCSALRIGDVPCSQRRRSTEL